MISDTEEDIKLRYTSLKWGRGLNWLELKVMALVDGYTVAQELWDHSNNCFSPHTREDTGLCTPKCGHYEGWHRHHRTQLLQLHSLGDKLGHSGWGCAELQLGSQLCRRRSQWDCSRQQNWWSLWTSLSASTVPLDLLPSSELTWRASWWMNQTIYHYCGKAGEWK